MIVRPGPASIAAGIVPGGVVIRVYDVPSCVLLLERRAASLDDVARCAVSDAELINALTTECCLVAYDGDTGERMSWPA